MGLFDWLFESNDKKETRKRIFISFAVEDEIYRDYLVVQARNNRSPFDFIDMSIKSPYKENEWKKRCRTKMLRCHGVIVLLSTHTYQSSGAKFEISCAKEEGIPIIGMHIKKNAQTKMPKELARTKIITWTWANIDQFLQRLS